MSRGKQPLAARIEKFWRGVRKTEGCWLWLGSKNPHGYGHSCLNGKRMAAHRVAWQITKGTIPAGMRVLHRCDNPSCVNPAHLFLGTAKDNMVDMKNKGRNRFVTHHGEAQGNSRLTWAKVRRMRQLRARGLTFSELSARFHCSSQNAWLICAGKRWKEGA